MSARTERGEREKEENEKRIRLAQKLVETAAEQSVSVSTFLGSLNIARDIALAGKLNLYPTE